MYLHVWQRKYMIQGIKKQVYVGMSGRKEYNQKKLGDGEMAPDIYIFVLNSYEL